MVCNYWSRLCLLLLPDARPQHRIPVRAAPVPSSSSCLFTRRPAVSTHMMSKPGSTTDREPWPWSPDHFSRRGPRVCPTHDLLYGLTTPRWAGAQLAPTDRLSDSCSSKSNGTALGFTSAELGLVHYRPRVLVITLQAQIRIKCVARDSENAPFHICKKSGRGQSSFLST